MNKLRCFPRKIGPSTFWLILLMPKYTAAIKHNESGPMLQSIRGVSINIILYHIIIIILCNLNDNQIWIDSMAWHTDFIFYFVYVYGLDFIHKWTHFAWFGFWQMGRWKSLENCHAHLLKWKNRKEWGGRGFVWFSIQHESLEWEPNQDLCVLYAWNIYIYTMNFWYRIETPSALINYFLRLSIIRLDHNGTMVLELTPAEIAEQRRNKETTRKKTTREIKKKMD